MLLQQWTTNHSSLRTQIKSDFSNDEISSSVNILSILWNAEEDTLSTKQVKFSDVKLTKCNFLALVSTVFDALGPIALLIKMLSHTKTSSTRYTNRNMFQSFHYLVEQSQRQKNIKHIHSR